MSAIYRRGLLVCLLLALFFTLLVALDFFSFIARPMLDGTSVYQFIYPPGRSSRWLTRSLYRQGVLAQWRYQYYLELLIRLQGAPQDLQAGEYVITSNTTPQMLLLKLRAGDVVTYHVTLVNGWTLDQALTVLRQQTAMTHTPSTQLKDLLRQRLGIQHSSLEGLFYPDTYQYTRGTSDIDILTQAYALMQTHLKTAWRHREPGLPFKNPYQALIAASLIEKETAKEEERGLIASVLVRRLQKRMRLQFDPTVIYGLGAQFTGRLSKADLLADNPYNTYTRYGLPPTPIALSSAASMQAVCQPADTEYLYFVAKGDGSHQFSRNLSEHNAAVRLFIKQRSDSSLCWDCHPLSVPVNSERKHRL